ncbi:hypothetical protein, partial [Candidatus Magnetominusculus xianensis]|uniref:hypothetical protein n=1 Tax=Candidatus Magnetominusculus xianensis TaxID=1748249 RepID=UPI001F1AB376
PTCTLDSSCFYPPFYLSEVYYNMYLSFSDTIIMFTAVLGEGKRDTGYMIVYLSYDDWELFLH